MRILPRLKAAPAPADAPKGDGCVAEAFSGVRREGPAARKGRRRPANHDEGSVYLSITGNSQAFTAVKWSVETLMTPPAGHSVKTMIDFIGRRSTSASMEKPSVRRPSTSAPTIKL